MDADMRDWFKTVATVDAAAIAVVATFAGTTGSQEFNRLALLALVFLVVSLVSAVRSLLVPATMEPGGESRLASYSGALTLGGFLVGFVLLAIYGATRLV